MALQYATARSVTRHTAEVIRPARTQKPSEAAAEFLNGWDAALAPMLIEPLDLLESRQYNGIVVVGPARSSKTMTLVLGSIAYIVKCAPGDVQVTQMSKEAARDFSQTDLDRAIRRSPALAAALSPRAQDDNTFDKFFRSGIRLKVGWPASSQLASKTLRYAISTDYDRPENRDNVDGDGPLWDQLYKRIETYLSRGKAIAESSPEAEYLDPRWKPRTPHEAPPARGILELYNRGTRGRWYWPCLDCGERFEAAPGLSCFRLPPLKQLEVMVREAEPLALAEEFARVPCIKCGAVHLQQHRKELNARGRWLHEGEQFSTGDVIVGNRRSTKIASVWFGGVAATFQPWSGLLMKYFQALNAYLNTGEESALKFTVNTDQAAAYLPRVASNRRSTDELKTRLEELARGTVPQAARFVTAAVDIQANRFVIHVFAWGVGLESWIIDRFVISSSQRKEGDRTAALDPAAYLEDWDALLDDVIERKYPIAGTDLLMPTRLTMCDSGGKTGVTARAYAYFRWLRKRRKHRHFRLVKGARMLDAPTARLSWPDASDRKDRKQGGRGDVPVWMINTNVLKDAVIGDLARTEVGPGFVHLPKWLEHDADFFAEYAAEERTDKGWKNPTKARNEALDLHVYNRAACKVMKADKINWQNPPTWARPYAEQGLATIAESEATTPPPPPGDEEPPTPPQPAAPAPTKHWSKRPPRKNWVRSW